MMGKIGLTHTQTHNKMSDSKKKTSAKPKSVAKKETAEAPKKEASKAIKKPYREALADLKADYLAAVAADTKKADSLRAKYKEDKKSLKASY